MAELHHTLSEEQYELLIDSLLRASVVAGVIEETADDLDPAALREMAKAMGERVLECLAIGRFAEDDIRRIQQSVMADMFTRPDA